MSYFVDIVSPVPLNHARETCTDWWCGSLYGT